MKKATYIFGFVLLFSITPSALHAQSFYLSFGAGYGIGINGSRVNSYSTTYTYKIDTSYSHNTYSSNRVSLGNGFIPSLNLGIMFNKNIGFDISTAYLFGQPYEYSQSDNYDFPYGYNSSIALVQSLSGKSLLFIPSIIIKSNLESSLNYYLKAGFALGSSRIDEVSKITIMDGTSGKNNPYTHIDYTKEFGSSFSYGMQVSAGIELYFLENLNLYAECGYLGYSTTPKSSETVSYTYEGKDKLSELTTKQKETIYVESYTEDDPIADNEPDKKLYTTYSFNMLHIEIGARWSFGNKE